MGAWRGRARPSRRTHLLAVLALAVVATVGVLLATGVLALPTSDTVTGWTRRADQLGPALPVVFVLVHVLVTTTPVPRTAFSVAAGVLFGPALGLGLTLLAATGSAVLALLLVRAVGRDAVAARLQHRSLRTVDARLRQRGWLAVLSLRLVPVVPFWLINYSVGVSSARVLPFAVATAVGMVPGTLAVVLLGDAVSGGSSPTLLVVSVVCGAVGVAGLALDARLPVTDKP